MPGGGGSSGVDAAYNARMATLSEEQHGWAKEYMSLYKYGNTKGIDYNEKVTGYYDGDKFIETSSSNTGPQKNQAYEDKVNQIMGQTTLDGGKYTREQAETLAKASGFSPEITVPDDVELVTKTRGEIAGVDPTTSYMQMEQAQIAENMKIMPAMTDQAISEATLAKGKADADIANMPKYQDATGATYDYTKAKADADKGLIPDYTNATRSTYNLAGETAEADRSLLPGQTALRGALNAEQGELSALRRPVTKQYFDTVAKGVDVQGEVNRAKADVVSGYKDANERAIATQRQYGINPNSGRGRSAINTSSMAFGRDAAAAQTAARTSAEDKDFDRKRTAMTTALPTGAVY